MFSLFALYLHAYIQPYIYIVVNL